MSFILFRAVLYILNPYHQASMNTLLLKQDWYTGEQRFGAKNPSKYGCGVQIETKSTPGCPVFTQWLVQ